VSVDAFPGMALTMEPAEAGTMTKRPRPRHRPILFGRMWVYITLHSAVVALCSAAVFCLSLYYYTGYLFASDLEVMPECRQYDLGTGQWASAGAREQCYPRALGRARFVIFANYSFAEIFRAYTVRTRFPFNVTMFANRSLNLAVLFALALTCTLLFFPPLRDMWGFHPVH
ncbi:MAG: cation transporting ATPase C-terminal domain-containing protein, partial [Hydrogenophaga sp.]